MVLAQQREAPPGCALHPLPPQLPSHSASPPQQTLPFAVPNAHQSSDSASVGVGAGVGHTVSSHGNMPATATIHSLLSQFANDVKTHVLALHPSGQQ